MELTRAAVDAGYTSVMIDASRESFDDNVRETRDVVYAHARGVHVEAKLGTLAGIEDLGERSARSMLTDPDQAVRFAAATEVDALAVAVGTSHGACKFKGEPHLDFARLQEIASRIHQPLVLHGASSLPQDQILFAERYGAKLEHAQGIPPELIKKAVTMGVAKVNTDSDLRLRPSGACDRCSWNARTSSTSTSWRARSRKRSDTRPCSASDCSAATQERNHRSSTARVCRAIIRSSSVGTTRTVQALPSTLMTGSCRAFRS